MLKGERWITPYWSLKDPEGRKVSSFEGMACIGKEYFQSLFKVDQRVSMVDIVRMALFFPRFVGEDENISLIEEVTEEELKEVLHSFQKDKSPGPDGWTIEFFIGLYELIGADILRVVEESRTEGHMHAPFKSTFIALILKYDDPSSLDDFHPISLCNCIYKVISKIIERRIKAILSKNISREQFGFLEGRQIHEAIGVAQEVMHSLKS
jgi:hypothetical protein